MDTDPRRGKATSFKWRDQGGRESQNTSGCRLEDPASGRWAAQCAWAWDRGCGPESASRAKARSSEPWGTMEGHQAGLVRQGMLPNAGQAETSPNPKSHLHGPRLTCSCSWGLRAQGLLYNSLGDGERSQGLRRGKPATGRRARQGRRDRKVDGVRKRPENHNSNRASVSRGFTICQAPSSRSDVCQLSQPSPPAREGLPL